MCVIEKLEKSKQVNCDEKSDLAPDKDTRTSG